MRLTVLIAGFALFCSGDAAAKTVKTERVSEVLEFTYEWPEKADQISGLHAYLQSDMEQSFRHASADATDDARAARGNHYPFRQHSFSMSWDSEGESTPLISLEGNLAFDTNGAHPNSGTLALLWDRSLDRQLSLTDLFAASSRFQALTRATYCRALDTERLRRRQGEKLMGEFAQCPADKALSIVLVDRNRNHRFDHISFVASPYVAGPYVEGEYDISVPVTANLVAAMKREYRTSFEAQRQ